MDEFNDIFKRIDELRWFGQKTYAAKPVNLLDEIGDYKANTGYSQLVEREYITEFMKSQGFEASSNKWVLLTERQARIILTFLLLQDLAYGAEDPEKLEDSSEADKKSAESIVSDLFAQFDTNKVLFATIHSTQYKTLKVGESNSSVLDGISEDATFDCGLVLYDTNKIACIWFEDED